MKLICACAVRLGVRAYFLFHGYLIDSAPFIEALFLPSLNCSDMFVVNQVTVYVWVCFWTVFSSVTLLMADTVESFKGCYTFAINVMLTNSK